jgi:hypothetical protein
MYALYYDPAAAEDTLSKFLGCGRVFACRSMGRRRLVSSRRSDAIQPGHFGSGGAPFPQIPREVLKEGLLLEVRNHFLHDLANVDEPKGIGWVLK